MTDQNLRPLASRHVAVIGAGASGLVAARELLREGHRVAVFERAEEIGGTWLYTPRVESDPIGLDPNRSFVHSSVYESLRTNLPREIMGFRDYPFVGTEHDEVRDSRRFPGHREVLMYLRDFSKEFGIDEFVRFGTEVVSVSPVIRSDQRERTQWRVVSKKKGDLVGVADEVFDAVVVCSGHYSEPRIAEGIPGIDAWPGKQIHSHNYRTPQPFSDQIVVVIGLSASAIDISRDISGVAKEVHIAARSITNQPISKLPGSDNIWLHSMIRSVHDNSRVVFEDASVVFADTIIHCTGYKFHYPFLETDDIVTVDDNRVGPLYKHVFPPTLAPWLSFVGVPFRTIPFPLFELQTKWISGVLSNRIELPSEKDMMDDIAAHYAILEQNNVPKHYTHDVLRLRFEYEDWLVVQTGSRAYEEWRKEMVFRLFKAFFARRVMYRDDFNEEDLTSQALRDLQTYIPTGVVLMGSKGELRLSRL